MPLAAVAQTLLTDSDRDSTVTEAESDGRVPLPLLSAQFTEFELTSSAQFKR